MHVTTRWAVALLLIFFAACDNRANERHAGWLARLERVEAQHEALRQHGERIGEAVVELRRLAGEPAPAELSGRQLSEWDQQTAWLDSLAGRLDGHGSRLQDLLGEQGGALGGLRPTENGAAAAGAMLDEMAGLNMEFLSLQNAVQMESRKYQTLSNASKARHDVAMAAIRNTNS